MSARATKLFKDPAIKSRRSASTPPPKPAEEKEPTRLWKALARDSGLRYRPVPAVPELAKLIGINKALLLAQLDFWLGRADYVDEDGRAWCYNTLEEWQANLPWLSLSSIKRLFDELRFEDPKLNKMKRHEPKVDGPKNRKQKTREKNRLGLVFIEQFDVSRLRRENWYSLNYPALEKLRERVAVIAQETDLMRETVKTRRRFSGGAQPLLHQRYEVGV